MYCPFGIDIAYLMLTVRRICHLLGVTPLYIQDTAHSHATTMNQMWVKDDEWIDTLQWQEEEAQAEIPTLRIPLEKEGADIMYTVNAREVKHYPEDLAEAAILFHLAGESWTVPSTGWEQTSLAMFAGDWEACKIQVESVYAAMVGIFPPAQGVQDGGQSDSFLL